MSAAVASERRAIGVSLEELAQAMGAPYPAFLRLGLVTGTLSLVPTATFLEPTFALHTWRPEALERRGITTHVLTDAAAELLTAAHRRADREARRRGLALSARWRLSGSLAKAAAQRLREAVRAERREAAARILAEADAAKKAKAAAQRTPRPLTPEEQDRATAAAIVALHRRHGGASGAPASSP